VKRYRPDAILTSGPPHQIHNLGWILKRRFGTPWLADFRDPWVACTSRRADHPLKGRWEAKQERTIMRWADVVIANTPNACAALQEAYPEASAKMVTITNGFDPERFTGPARAIERSAPEDGPVTILHPGNIYGARDPRPLLDAIRDFCAERTTKARPIRVLFLGMLKGNPHAAALSSAIQDAGLGSVVSCMEQVPYSEALDAMLRSDILLLLISPGQRIGIPAKLFEFIGAGRPVLAVAEPDGDTAWALREGGLLHRVGAPDDPADIKRALKELIHEIEAGKGPRIPDIENSTFTREKMTRRLAELLGRCTAPPGPVSNASFPDWAHAGAALGGRLADR
jgi:glycosyltransferase involved in cell wall biosynthesis